MVNLCYDFATKKTLMFSTKANPRDRAYILPMQLNSPLPWVSQGNYLGNLVQVENSMKVDVEQKRGKFMGKVISLLQELHYVVPELLTRIMNKYIAILCGSNHNVVRLDMSHRYLIEGLSRSTH